MKKAAIVFMVFSFVSVSAIAQRGGGKQKHQARVTACEGKQVGDSCTFEGRRSEEVSGQCIEGKRDSSVIVCHDPNRKMRKKKNRE